MTADETLARLLVWLQTGAFELVELDDLDEALDTRDEESFTAAWMGAFDLVQSGGGENEAIAAIREAAFRQAFARWKSGDLAGYVSDDWGLIAQAIVGGVRSTFVAGLLAAYFAGRFPAAVDDAENDASLGNVAEVAARLLNA